MGLDLALGTEFCIVGWLSRMWGSDASVRSGAYRDGLLTAPCPKLGERLHRIYDG